MVLGLLCFVLTSCNKKLDPNDEDFPPEKWTPTNLMAEVRDDGVMLTWKQPVEAIEGFIIENSQDSLNWRILTQNVIDSKKREYLDGSVKPGDIIFYRIYAKANSNKSNYCYSKAAIVPLKLPSVVTSEVSDILSSSVKLNGAATKDGGKTITERGFCYSLKSTPTTKDSKVSVGTGIGTFTKTIEKLNFATTYYVRAYATNANGTAYGEEKSFKTLAVLPNLEKSSISNIDSISATLSGKVISDGGSTITERGFCYSENGVPNVNSSKISLGNGVGSFTIDIKNLKWTTRYYVRAYAINEIGIQYGDLTNFFTKCDCEKKYGTFIDTRDNHIYKTIKIGTQTWMAENLSYLPYTTLSKDWSTDKPCYTSSPEYGVFYNWKAALTACPTGWHLPNNDEWATLENYLITTGYNYDHSKAGNKIAKSLASDGIWKMLNSNFEVGQVGYNQDENNTSCFSAKAGNIIYFRIHYYSNEGTTSYWWSKTAAGNSSFIKGISSYSSSFENPISLSVDALYVRCIKD